MIPLTPAFLVATASAFIGLGEDTQTSEGQGSNGATCTSNTNVDRLLRQVRARPGGIIAPWDAAFVHHVGYWSHFDHEVGESSWPIPAALNAQSLADFARVKNILDPRPEVGDLFVLWSPATRRYVHTGIVVRVGPRGQFADGVGFIECDVVSGNVRPNGKIGGPGMRRLTRRISPFHGDRFVRWTRLDQKEFNEQLAMEESSPFEGVDDEYHHLWEAA